MLGLCDIWSRDDRKGSIVSYSNALLFILWCHDSLFQLQYLLSSGCRFAFMSWYSRQEILHETGIRVNGTQKNGINSEREEGAETTMGSLYVWVWKKVWLGQDQFRQSITKKGKGGASLRVEEQRAQDEIPTLRRWRRVFSPQHVQKMEGGCIRLNSVTLCEGVYLHVVDLYMWQGAWRELRTNGQQFFGGGIPNLRHQHVLQLRAMVVSSAHWGLRRINLTLASDQDTQSPKSDLAMLL